MKTISFRIAANEDLEKVISRDSKICSSMYRFAFNRFVDGLKNLEVYASLTEQFDMNSHVINSVMRNAATLASLNKGKKVHFGKFLRFKRGVISKEELKESRNIGILSEGEALKKGNRLFEIDAIHQKVIYKRSRKEHYDLEIAEKLSPKRLHILSKLQLLMSEKKIPVTFRLKKDKIFITYDEKVVEKEKQFKNLFSNRVLGIDLNPDYFGISIIEFREDDTFKIIHKEVIDVSRLQKKSKNKIRFELFEIDHYILKLCKTWHCAKLAVEDLKFDSKKKFWNKDLNRLCRNQFRFGIVKQHLQTLCSTFGVELVEVNAAYSSIIGNFVHGSDTCPDMVAASIEIARRSYKRF